MRKSSSCTNRRGYQIARPPLPGTSITVDGEEEDRSIGCLLSGRRVTLNLPRSRDRRKRTALLYNGSGKWKRFTRSLFNGRGRKREIAKLCIQPRRSGGMHIIADSAVLFLSLFKFNWKMKFRNGRAVKLFIALARKRDSPGDKLFNYFPVVRFASLSLLL